jgi:hypothetical protein
MLTAGDLKAELAPSVDGEKTILLKMVPGKRPEVVFTGFWTGKYIAAATNSIAKAYRVARRNIIKPRMSVEETLTPQNAVEKKEA